MSNYKVGAALVALTMALATSSAAMAQTTLTMDLAKFFVDARGQQPHYFVKEAAARGEPADHFAHGCPTPLPSASRHPRAG